MREEVYSGSMIEIAAVVVLDGPRLGGVRVGGMRREGRG